MPDDLEVRPPGRRRLDAQHLLRGAIDQLQASLPIDDEHALDHAAEDGFHARPIARQFLDAAAELLDGLVECAGHGPELVGAVVVDRAREIACGIALGDRAQSR